MYYSAKFYFFLKLQVSDYNKGWEIFHAIKDGLGKVSSVEMRRMLASYMSLPVERPSKLHSAILMLASKMATIYPDFHFVPFLNAWGLENLRPEDGESRTDESGKCLPSTLERLVKGYAHSLLFHPGERLDEQCEMLLSPSFEQRGYSLSYLTVPAIATRVSAAQFRGRKVTFVDLVAADGQELSVDAQTLTTFAPMRYSEIPNRYFHVLLRNVHKRDGSNAIRIEAALLGSRSLEEIFPTAVGYVEHIDLDHDHIHIYDSFSRHLVASHSPVKPLVGQYVRFVPIVPREHKFKSALITRIFNAGEGPEAFGFRQAKVTFADPEGHYCSWELTDDNPIVEKGTTEPACTKGYISEQLFKSNNSAQVPRPMPKMGDLLNLVVFLKRGKDHLKRPYVVDYRIIS